MYRKLACQKNIQRQASQQAKHLYVIYMLFLPFYMPYEVMRNFGMRKVWCVLRCVGGGPQTTFAAPAVHKLDWISHLSCHHTMLSFCPRTHHAMHQTWLDYYVPASTWMKKKREQMHPASNVIAKLIPPLWHFCLLPKELSSFYPTSPCDTLMLPPLGTLWGSGGSISAKGKVLEELVWSRSFSKWPNGEKHYSFLLITCLFSVTEYDDPCSLPLSDCYSSVRTESSSLVFVVALERTQHYHCCFSSSLCCSAPLPPLYLSNKSSPFQFLRCGIIFQTRKPHERPHIHLRNNVSSHTLWLLHSHLSHHSGWCYWFRQTHGDICDGS